MLKVIIPCFPRSGTSFLAGLIVRMGFNPGPEKWLKKADELNPFGYYECLPLLKISRGILKKFGGDILKNIPDLPNGWINELETEKRQILDIVYSGKVEIFKDAPMLIIADLYDELFPRAKWIVIHRDVRETFKSRFGKPLTYEEWGKITRTRLRKWQQTKPSSKALNLDYKDFFVDCQRTIEKISTFLEIQLTAKQMKECMDFFKPGQRKNHNIKIEHVS
jgi:hypothetical protein